MRAILRIAPLLIICLQAQAWDREPAIAASVVSLLVWNPMQLNGVGVDQMSDHNFDRTRMLWLWDFDDSLKEWGWLTLEGHLELAFGQTTPTPPDVSIGLTPILEWTVERGPWRGFVETGLGAHYLTRTTHEDRDLSTHFQFGEILGAGARYKNLQLGLRFQHLSNGDIVKPNNGYNFYGIALKFWY